MILSCLRLRGSRHHAAHRLLPCLSVALAFALAAVFAPAASAVTSTATAVSGESRPARVLVIGATGRTGREIVSAAQTRGLQVRVLVRDLSSAQARFANTVEYVVGDVRKPQDMGEWMKDVDYVISALGSNVRREPENTPQRIDYAATRDLAAAAAAAKIKHFVLVSSMGVTHDDHMLNRMLDNILKWKLQGEDALRDSGVPYTVVRPGGLRDGPRSGLIRVKQGDDPADQGQISRADVAYVCLEILGRPEALGKRFEIVAEEWSSRLSTLKMDPQPTSRASANE